MDPEPGTAPPNWPESRGPDTGAESAAIKSARRGGKRKGEVHPGFDYGSVAGESNAGNGERGAAGKAHSGLWRRIAEALPPADHAFQRADVIPRSKRVEARRPNVVKVASSLVGALLSAPAPPSRPAFRLRPGGNRANAPTAWIGGSCGRGGGDRAFPRALEPRAAGIPQASPEAGPPSPL